VSGTISPVEEDFLGEAVQDWVDVFLGESRLSVIASQYRFRLDSSNSPTGGVAPVSIT
jgi:hypothetical protein